MNQSPVSALDGEFKRKAWALPRLVGHLFAPTFVVLFIQPTGKVKLDCYRVQFRPIN